MRFNVVMIYPLGRSTRYIQQILTMDISPITVFCNILLIFSVFRSISTETCAEDFGEKYRCISENACSQTVSIVDAICGPLNEGQCCPVINKRSPPTCGVRKARFAYREYKETHTIITSKASSIGKNETLQISHKVYENFKTSTESINIQTSQKSNPISTKNRRAAPPTGNLETVVEFDKVEETGPESSSVFKNNTSIEDSNRTKNLFSSPIPMALNENLNNDQIFMNQNNNSAENTNDTKSTTEKSIRSSDVSLFSHTKVDEDLLVSTESISSVDVYKQSPSDKMNEGQRTTLPDYSEISKNETIDFLTTNMSKAAAQISMNVTKTYRNLEDVEHSSSVNTSAIPSAEDISDNVDNDDNDDKDEGLLQTIGGNLEYEEWPWMVSIYKHINSSIHFFCGGALIDDRHIISAAHCFYGRENMNYIVSIGNILRISDASDGYKIEKVIAHEGFKPSCYCNDIAVIRLTHPLTSYTPVCLADFDTAVVGECSTILGWGDRAYQKPDTSTKRLQKVSDMRIMSSKTCREVLSRILKRELPKEFEKYTICAGLPDGSKDACLGDSGGPLMYETYEGTWIILGVVSFGYKCGEPGIPGTYSKISYHMPWILKVIGSE